MPKVSIVVPVYNVKDYLEKCVDSILRQTEREFELLLIDDGSTDGSGELCDTLAERDGRVRVIHQENRGLPRSRKVGVAAPGTPGSRRPGEHGCCWWTATTGSSRKFWKKP